MSDFIRDSLTGTSIQTTESDESTFDIQMGNTIGDRDWAWENICFEQEQLEKKLRSKIQELLQLQTEHEDLKEKLVENERQKREVQADLENQMENTQKLIARITQEKSKNRKLEEDISYLRQLEGKVNDITDRNYDLEKSINSLNVLLQTCLEEIKKEREKGKFLEQIYDRKDSALQKSNEHIKKLEKKLSILTAAYNTVDVEQIDNKRFKRRRIQECRRCHKAIEPGEITGQCRYHSQKPVHLMAHEDPKTMIWPCCEQVGKIEPVGCEYRNEHEPL